LLGRKKSPDWSNHLDFLRQIAASKERASCTSEEAKQTSYSLDQLATLMANLNVAARPRARKRT